jgi:hypothetical protein
VKLFVTSATRFPAVELASAVGAAARDEGGAALAGFVATRTGLARAGGGGERVGDVKTVGGATTAGPSSALSQSDAASAGTPTGVTGRRL